MKIHPIETASNDLAQFQRHTADLFLDRTNGLDHLAGKHRRLQRLAARARHERRWKKDEERCA